jgi:hypothetical protein
MYVSEIYNAARAAIGNCSQEEVFAALTEALNLLRNQNAYWDWTTGYVEICADSTGLVTLPREIETPLALTQNDVPSFPRDEWFQYHLNGLGSRYTATEWAWDDLDDVCTIRELSANSYLEVEPLDPRDNGKTLSFFGYDANSKEVQTDDGTGNLVQGETVVCDYGTNQRTTVLFRNLNRVRKDPTMGTVRVWAVNGNTGAKTLIGYYYNTDTNPQYRRIKVRKCASVKMRYRRRFNKITSLNDWIPLDNTLAIKKALRGWRYLENDQNEKGDAELAVALKLLEDEQASRHPESIQSLQIETRTVDTNETIWGAYGNGSYRSGGWLT